MKTKFILFIIIASAGIINAQIPNNSFENNNQCNLTSCWSYMPLQAVIVDSSGNTITDSIIWDAPQHALSIPVPDPYTGSQAISLRNAYSYNTGQKYIGRSSVYPDSSECTAFFQTLLPISYGPIDFSFYYKYSPLNGDTAYALAVLYDQYGTEVARAEQWLMGVQSSYVQNITPFVYSSLDSVAYYSISFHNMIPDGYTHQSTFGTRLTVDDVSFSGNMSVASEKEEIKVQLFPNPAQETLIIQSESNLNINQVFAFNLQGESIALSPNGALQYDCSGLPNGMYQLKIVTDKRIIFRKFIKD